MFLRSSQNQNQATPLSRHYLRQEWSYTNPLDISPSDAELYTGPLALGLFATCVFIAQQKTDIDTIPYIGTLLDITKYTSAALAPTIAAYRKLSVSGASLTIEDRQLGVKTLYGGLQGRSHLSPRIDISTLFAEGGGIGIKLKGDSYEKTVIPIHSAFGKKRREAIIFALNTLATEFALHTGAQNINDLRKVSTNPLLHPEV